MLIFWLFFIAGAGLILGYLLLGVIGIVEMLLPGNRVPPPVKTILDDHGH